MSLYIYSIYIYTCKEVHLLDSLHTTYCEKHNTLYTIVSWLQYTLHYIMGTLLTHGEYRTCLEIQLKHIILLLLHLWSKHRWGDNEVLNHWLFTLNKMNLHCNTLRWKYSEYFLKCMNYFKNSGNGAVITVLISITTNESTNIVEKVFARHFFMCACTLCNWHAF